MSAIDRLKALAADPLPGMTARAIIEARIGRPLGDLRARKRNEPDTCAALRALAVSLVKTRARA